MKKLVALLQTDLVDSTHYFLSLGEEAARAKRKHDDLARDLLVRWNGRELERSDGFLTSFETAEHAVRYALEYHDALAGLSPPILARAGINIGPLDIHENNELHVRTGARTVEADGSAIALTVRVMSVARGGQTLLTAEAHEASVAAGFFTTSHGYWMFKGLETPVEVFEVRRTEGGFSSPTDAAKAFRVTLRNRMWMPVRETPHSLPIERNAIVPRDDATAGLDGHIRDGAHLVTILGMGGIGKTRFIQHFGWQRLAAFPGGVWFCDLSQAITFEGVVSAVAQGLRVPLGPTDAVEQVGNAIAARGRCMVILDNFEQVSGFAMETVGRWMDGALDALFVVTSRSVLDLDGEAVLNLVPMTRDQSRALFIQRARAASDRFVHSADDESNLAALIDLLEGIPLAIELAAPRVRIMSLAMMVDRMRERFTLLGGRSGRAGRQATLRATLDWSWDLLSGPEQASLCQLSVFEGGFAVKAAEAVLQVDLEAQPLDLVQRLVEKSWLYRIEGTRHSMLKSVQQYIIARLASDATEPRAAQEMADTRRRHWLYYAALSDREAASDRCVEIDNLVLGVRNATSRCIPAEAALVLVKCWHVIKLCGPYEIVCDLCDALRPLATDMAQASASIEYVAGSALMQLGAETEAIAAFERGIDLAGLDGYPLECARLYTAYGELESSRRSYDSSRRYLEIAWRLAATSDDQALQYFVLNARGNLAQLTESFDDAEALYRRALELAVAEGDRRAEAGLRGNLGTVAFRTNQLIEGRRWFEQALSIATESGDQRYQGNILCNLGLLLHEQGESPAALEKLRAALMSARLLGRARLELSTLWNLALVHAGSGADADASARLFDDALDAATRLHDSFAMESIAIDRARVLGR